jgi:hypothetical protein
MDEGNARLHCVSTNAETQIRMIAFSLANLASND